MDNHYKTEDELGVHIDDSGYACRFANCTHPDCVLVRSSAETQEPREALHELERALELQEQSARSVVGMAGADVKHNERYSGKADGIAQARGSVRILLDRLAASTTQEEK